MFKLFFCTIYTGTESSFSQPFLCPNMTDVIKQKAQGRDEHWRGIVLNVKLVIDGEIRAQKERSEAKVRESDAAAAEDPICGA